MCTFWPLKCHQGWDLLSTIALQCICAGQSKGFCYVNYTSQAAAAAAMETLNGLEFPPHCGQRMKVRHRVPIQ